jgi:DNA-binding MarR family transcriptional regulator
MIQPSAPALRSEKPKRREIDLRKSRLSGLIGFHLRLAQVAVYRDFVTATAELKMTPKQYAVLELVAENAGASQVDLAEALLMDRATMMALVDRLEARDLIERRASPLDRRRQSLFITAAGEIFLESARAAISTHEARLLEAFTPEEAALTIRLLRRLQTNSITTPRDFIVAS